MAILLVSLSVASAFQPSYTNLNSVGILGPRSNYDSTSHIERHNIQHSSSSSSSIQRQISSPLYSVISDVESQAAIAADTWSIEATQFFEPDIASQIEEKFQDRGDVIAYRVVGGRRSPAENADESMSSGEGRRSRFVLMHPDLGLDIGTAESEYCTVIRVDNVNVASSNTLPNALASIGVHLENVGDIIVYDSSTVYLVVDPNVAKQCLRLLSKELVGVGINLSVCDSTEFMPHGEIQEMKLSRILERQMERKKLEGGYVQFS